MKNLFTALALCLLVISPLWGQEKKNSTVYGYRGGAKKIAFTFDDGPHGEHTPRLLDILKKHKIKATFFVLGKNARRYPLIIKRMIKEGHTVASHSYSHPQLPKLSEEDLTYQLVETEKVLKEITGQRPYWMRPPYGALNRRVKNYIYSRNYTILLWNIDSLDWKYRDVDKVVNHTLKETSDHGGILLLHDIHKTSVDAVPHLIARYKERGYEFVTLDYYVKAKKGNSSSTSTSTNPPPLPDESEIKKAEGVSTVTATRLNFRKGPSTDYPVLETLKKGTKVTLLGRYKEWYKVRIETDSGPQVAWTHSNYLSQPTQGIINRVEESTENQ